MQREHGVQSGTGVCQESKTVPMILILDVTQGRISQICSKLLHEIFGKEKGGAAELIEKLHELH